MPEVTNRQLASAIRECRGNLSAVAGKLGKKRTTLYMRCSKNPRLKRVLDESRESTTDAIESVFIDNCLDPSPQFQPSRLKYLWSQARARGYVDRQEIELSGPGGGPVVTELVIEHQALATTIRTDAGSVDDLPTDDSAPAIADLPADPVSAPEATEAVNQEPLASGPNIT